MHGNTPDAVPTILHEGSKWPRINYQKKPMHYQFVVQ